MNSSTRNLTAQQAREVYIEDRIARRIKVNRSIIQANLPALEFPDALPNDEGVEENLIPTTMLSNPIKTVLPVGWQGGVPATLEVFLNEDEVNPIKSETYTTLPTFPLSFEIDPDRFSDAGVYRVRYRVTTRGGLEPSDTYQFTVDREDPNRNTEPPQLQLSTDRITPDYLTNNSGLPFSIPRFDNPRPGDYCVILMIAPGIAETEVFRTPARPVTGFDPNEATAGTIPEDQFVDGNGDPLFTDGTVTLSYLAYSRAGNEAKRPPATTVQMAFLPEPSGLQPAVIPLAAEPAPLIDRADAILGVTVQIEAFQNHLPTDEVVVQWGSRNIDRFKVGASPDFPLESRPVPYPTLLAEGATPGEGPKDVDITYSIIRGILTYSPPTKTSTSVDLRIPGPVNPDPGPENPNLGSVTVRGGGAAPEDNKIRVADIGQPVTVTLPITTPPLQQDDVLEVVWNEEATGETYEVQGGETTPYTITIPYDVVSRHGDRPDMPVQMSLTSGDPDIPDDNVPLTVKTPVEVDTFQLGTLTPPSFPDKQPPPFNSIGCPEKIWEGARFKVEGDTANFAEGDTVTVHWEGRVSGTDDTPIPGTKGNKPVKLTADQAANGFEERVPFTDALDKVADAIGVMVAWYHLQKDGGGPDASSDEITVYPSYLMPGGCKCIADGVCPPP